MIRAIYMEKGFEKREGQYNLLLELVRNTAYLPFMFLRWIWKNIRGK